jgi:pyridoxine 5-phosphate synthase
VKNRRLVVNVDHVATLRQARGGVEPDPVDAAVFARAHGAEGIVVHLREDRRHIQDRDVWLLRQTIPEFFCLEMAPTREMLKIALDVRPDSVTLVPERREELTTEGGLDVPTQMVALAEITSALNEAGIRSCVFIDPDVEQVKAVYRINARAVELHTGRYADRHADRAAELSRLSDAVTLAAKLRLEIGVGHGLDYRNVRPVAAIEKVEEFSVGHAIVSRAVLVGLGSAVAEMRRLVG